MPLGAHYNSCVEWDGVEDRFSKRLVIWKKGNISQRVEDALSEVVHGVLRQKQRCFGPKTLLCNWSWWFANEK